MHKINDKEIMQIDLLSLKKIQKKYLFQEISKEFIKNNLE